MRWTSFRGSPAGGNEVVPAARDVGLGIETKDGRGDGIAVVVVVKEPAVKRSIAQGRLDGIEIHHGTGYAGAAWSGRDTALGALELVALQFDRHVNKRERGGSNAGNAAGLAKGLRADALQRLAHLARKAANRAVFDPVRDGDGFGCLEAGNGLLLLLQIPGKLDLRFDCTGLVAHFAPLDCNAACGGVFSRVRCEFGQERTAGEIIVQGG